MITQLARGDFGVWNKLTRLRRMYATSHMSPESSEAAIAAILLQHTDTFCRRRSVYIHKESTSHTHRRYSFIRSHSHLSRPQHPQEIALEMIQSSKQMHGGRRERIGRWTTKKFLRGIIEFLHLRIWVSFLIPTLRRVPGASRCVRKVWWVLHPQWQSSAIHNPDCTQTAVI
jgi:hypothetical protein